MGIRTKLNPFGGKHTKKEGGGGSGGGGGERDNGPFGFRIDTTNSDPTNAVTYIGNNTSYTPASMDFSTGILDYGSWGNAFFLPRPVMLKSNGTVDYELDHNDFTKKLNGATSDVSNTSYDGNCMIAFPQVWLKFEVDGNYQNVYIAPEQIDSSYRCYTHINKNGKRTTCIYENLGTLDKFKQRAGDKEPLEWKNVRRNICYGIRTFKCFK